MLLRPSFTLIVAATLIGNAVPAAAQSPRPHATATSKSVKTHRQTFGSTARIHGSTANRPISAAACNQRAATLPGSTGTLGPNGASASQTVVAVPVGGGNVAAATQQQQIAEACAHVRR